MKYTILIVASLSAQISYSQNQKTKSAKGIYPDSGTTLQTLKDIALCKCLENGYNLDSLGVRDPSAWILIGTTNCDMGPLFELDSLTRKFIDTLPTLVQGADYENLIHKRIASSCLELYKSERLEEFIKKIMKENCKDGKTMALDALKFK